MVIIRTLIILVLVGLILGGAAFFSYELFWKPQKLDEEDRRAKAEQPAPTPPPDFSLPDFEKAMALVKSGNTEAARTALKDFLRNHPDSTKRAEAKTALGEIHLAGIFSPVESPDKTSYAVARGDSLVKVASKFKTNADLVYRASNLDSINLQIGQKLFIPQLETAIVVNREAGTVTLLNRGEFFKEYPALSVKVPAGVNSTKVADKIALKGSNRVAFGHKDYAESDRWLMLGGGAVIRGQAEGVEGPFPAGIILSQPDMEEIFLLVSRGAPVTIQ